MTLLLDYFAHRAKVLAEIAEPNLMDADEALVEFEVLRARVQPQRPFAMNKQKGEKAGPALLTGMVNMILESKVGDDCDYDPRQLTTVTRDGLPVRTLARRVDGAYPAVVNPIAVWEIKEYYHTTTFGSRVADGVYETMLDGLELQELRSVSLAGSWDGRGRTCRAHATRLPCIRAYRHVPVNNAIASSRPKAAKTAVCGDGTRSEKFGTCPPPSHYEPHGSARSGRTSCRWRLRWPVR